MVWMREWLRRGGRLLVARSVLCVWFGFEGKTEKGRQLNPNAQFVAELKKIKILKKL
ncbi:hypothetical protein Hanom_Chr08g00757591 [Helianthus anomalus]